MVGGSVFASSGPEGPGVRGVKWYSHVISIRSSPFLLLHHEEQAPMENDANTMLSISTVKDLDPVR